MSKKLGIVVPCYNEEEVIYETTKRLVEVINNLINDELISSDSQIFFVDDGSKDRTWKIIQEICRKYKVIKGIKLARNVGHQNALLGGLMTAKESCDLIISIDADLQDDVTKIKDFILKYYEGYDVVYGVRDSRDTDTFFKRNTALIFYRFMSLMGADIVYNHADYRLTSQRVLNELSNFREVNLFLRGLVPLVGFKSTSVYYDRSERFAGESKYPLKKMLSFAFDGITSLSIRPIRLISTVGFVISFLSVIAFLYAIISKITGNDTSGWTSLILSVWFLGGLQLIAMGLIGEYIGKIYNETKQRPRYIIEELI